MARYCLIFILALTGCTPPLTYIEAQATAQAGSCWPDYLPTPRPVTVTPASPSAAGTALPTTTPAPRCPPRPGRTAVAWPTPVPPPPPYPTIENRFWQTGSDRDTTLHLPSAVLALDLAAHPTAGWPAVGAVVWSGNADPERVMVSVYNPVARRWSIARQVDLGPSQIGRYSRTVAITITGDNQVHALWGMSDPDFSDNDPPAGIWTSSSADYGETWPTPLRIADGCRRVNAVVATPAGTLVVMLVCDAGNGSELAMVTRQANGTWQPVERLAVPVRFYSEGSLVLVGAGDDARAVGLVLVEGGGVPVGYLVSRRLTGSEPWRIERITITAAGAELGERMWHVRGLTFTRPGGEGVVFTFTDAERGGAYALTSLDGGRRWGAVERIATPDIPAGQIANAIPAYDAAADRLVVVWMCCAGGLFSMKPTTHYGSWSIPGSGVWQPAPDSPFPIPLVLGSQAAGETVGAQAANSRLTWLAWVERLKQIEVRSLDLNQIVPIQAYPTTTSEVRP